MTELSSPGGSLEMLREALKAGAVSVYVGPPEWSRREAGYELPHHLRSWKPFTAAPGLATTDWGPTPEQARLRRAEGERLAVARSGVRAERGRVTPCRPSENRDSRRRPASPGARSSGPSSRGRVVSTGRIARKVAERGERGGLTQFWRP